MYIESVHPVDRAVQAVAAAQSGAFARAQVLGAGGNDALISRRIRAGRWTKVEQGVYVLPGAPDDLERHLWVAHLAVGDGSILSHETAAERHGLRAVPRGLAVLTSGRGDHHRISGVFVHQLRDVLPHHVVELRGLPTTTVARTLVDCAAVLSRRRVQDLVEQALHERKARIDDIHRVVGDVDRRGKPGMREIAGALARLGPGRGVTESVLERMLLDAVLAAGNPMPVAQFAHPGRHPGNNRVDFAYPDVRVILEADGRTWHQRTADLARDRSRDNEAARAGWLTLRFVAEHLRDDPADVGATVKEVRQTRLPHRSEGDGDRKP